MMSSNTNYIGVDVSQKSLDYYPTAKSKVGKVKNTESDILVMLSKYDIQQDSFVVEPTGTYSDKFLSIASEHGFTIYLAHPRQSHHFMSMLGINNKNDKQAAKLLSILGNSIELPCYEMPTALEKERKQLLTTLNGLEKQKQSIENQIHALEQYQVTSTQSLKSLQSVRDIIVTEIKDLEAKLYQNKDEQWQHLQKLATSVKGIGPVNATYLLTITNGFKQFTTPKQVVKYLGLAPKIHRSGTSVRQNGGITKTGNASVRGKLFMAARSAITWNNPCKKLYKRLRKKGKPYYKVMVAVMAKLVRQVFAVVKSEIPFDNDYLQKKFAK